MTIAQYHPNDTAIREQAYFLWEQEGRPEGRDMEFWTRAEVSLAEKAQLDHLQQEPPHYGDAEERRYDA